jgi:hypothetical protein
LVDFLEYLNITDNYDFYNTISENFDVQRFLRNSCVEIYVMSPDNFFIGNNYKLYDNEGNWVLIPYDFEEIFTYPEIEHTENIYDFPFNFSKIGPIPNRILRN